MKIKVCEERNCWRGTHSISRQLFTGMLPNWFKYSWQKPHSAEGDQASSPDRDKRQILREIKKLRATVGSFAKKWLHEAAALQTGLSHETVRRFLHSQRYRYYHSRKKGLLSTEDLKRRLKDVTEISKRPDSKELWINGILFHIDAAGFQHKCNPFDEAKSIKTLAWRKHDEGLERNCTAKGSHAGSAGKVLHIMVAISYTQDVILCEQYERRMNGRCLPISLVITFQEHSKIALTPQASCFYRMVTLARIAREQNKPCRLSG